MAGGPLDAVGGGPPTTASSQPAGAPGGGWGSGSSVGGGGGHVQYTLHVSDAVVPAILGRGGQVITVSNGLSRTCNISLVYYCVTTSQVPM